MTTRPKKPHRQKTAKKRPAKRPMLPTDRIAYSPITERAAAEAAERRPHGGVGHRQCRGMGRDAADAAHRADAAGRRLADARRAQLGLARIRQPRRLLALHQGVRRVRHSRRARHQRLGACRLSADRARRGRTQLGIHRPRLHPAQHAEGAGRARRYPQSRATSSSRPPASRRAAGSDPASPKPGKRPISWSRKATTTSPTGCSTISRCG